MIQADDDKNTNVYVSGLPKSNYNLARFTALMKKCGLLKPDEKTGVEKIKLYHDEQAMGFFQFRTYDTNL